MKRAHEATPLSPDSVQSSKVEHIPDHAETAMYLEIAQRSAGMGYVSLDPTTMRLSLSQWVQDLIGSAEPTIPVAEVPRFLVPSEQERVMNIIAAIIAAREPFEFETRLVSASGPVTVRIAGTAVYATGGATLAGFYAIVQNIDAIRKSEVAALRSAERVEKELQARAAVATVLSHEIRTPLTGIIGIIDQLRREPRIEERQRGLALIEEAAQALLVTLDSVLQQARGEPGGKPDDQASFDPGDVVRRVAELFRPLARRKGLALECRETVDEETRPVLGDASRLQQILSNAISNAIKFTSTGRVEIAYDYPSDASLMWRFEISDTGSGIARDRLENIFVPLAGSEADTLGRMTGTGLGVSIIKHLVDEMGGTISIDSEIGEGTRVVIEIPYASLKTFEAKGGSRETVVFHCSTATRGIAVTAIAESTGLRAEPYAPNSEGSAKILVCDDAMIDQLDDRALERFTTVILVTENYIEEGLPALARCRQIQASRLVRDLPSLLVEAQT